MQTRAIVFARVRFMLTIHSRRFKIPSVIHTHTTIGPIATPRVLNMPIRQQDHHHHHPLTHHHFLSISFNFERSIGGSVDATYAWTVPVESSPMPSCEDETRGYFVGNKPELACESKAMAMA
jgi:hypothetical protein